MTDGFKDKENVSITSHFHSDTFSNKVFSQFNKIKDTRSQHRWMFGLESKLFVLVSILIINVFVVLRTKETVFLRCKEIWYDFKVEACVINSPTHWKKVLFNSLIFIICCLFGNFKWQFHNFGSLTWIYIYDIIQTI